MVTIFLLVAPDGTVAKASTDRGVVEQYRPAEDGLGNLLNVGYELFAFDVVEPWVEDRVERRRVVELGAKLLDGTRLDAGLVDGGGGAT